MDKFNSCLYPSALALIFVEFVHENKKLKRYLSIYTFLTTFIYAALNHGFVKRLIKYIFQDILGTIKLSPSFIFNLNFFVLGLLLIGLLYKDLYTSNE